MKPPPILIVHSDPRDLAKLAAILTEGRYTVLQATGYPEAAAILSRHRGRLVVLSELNVGNEDGHQFLKDTMKKYPFLPFIGRKGYFFRVSFRNWWPSSLPTFSSDRTTSLPRCRERIAAASGYPVACRTV